MTTWSWTPGAGDDWFDPANWTSVPPGTTGTPQSNDMAVIATGTAAIDGSDTVEGVFVRLGGAGNTGQPVGLVLDGAALDDMFVGVPTGGNGPATPVNAVIDVSGTTSFKGKIEVQAQNGGLTIDLSPGPGAPPGVLHLADDSVGGSNKDSLLTLAQQSTLLVRGGTVENDGFIQIEGVARFAANSTLSGDGRIEVENGGTLRIAGAVGEDQALVLPDGEARVVLVDPGSFDGGLQLTTTSGVRIDLRGIDVASVQVLPPELGPPGGPVQPSTLRLLDAGGATLMSIPVTLVNPADLLPLGQAQQSLSAAEFQLVDLGDRGTRLVYAPSGADILQASLPVPIIAPPGTLVELSDILQQAFGTATPDFPMLTLLPTVTPSGDIGYWGQPVNGESPVHPEWLVNGKAITEVTVPQPGDLVQLKVGNNVNNPPQMLVQLSQDSFGPAAVFTTYDIWTVAPKAATPLSLGGPRATDIVAAAQTHASVYAGVVNTDLCNWIADNIAAAAGAPMPLPNASLSPNQNVEGGFWRIAYRGSDGETPVAQWWSEVRPGYIVRLQWTTQTGHTTTVIEGYDPTTKTITVYDNIGPPAPAGNDPQGNTTAIHTADYWNSTSPEGITVYRLAEEPQYLINGTKQAEFIQGTVFDDLIRPGGGRDTIALGPGADEIEGTLRDLRGDVLRGFDAADVIHVTDLAFAGASVQLRGETLLLFSNGDRVGMVELDGIAPGTGFSLTSDGGTGTLIAVHTVIA